MAPIPVNPYFRSKSAEHDVTLTSFVAELWYPGLSNFNTMCKNVGREGTAILVVIPALVWKISQENERGDSKFPPVGRGLTLAPLGGGQRAPLWFFTNCSWSTGNIALKLAIPLRTTIPHLVSKNRTQVIIGQPWVTSEWRHVSPILINKMGLRESLPLVQF